MLMTCLSYAGKPEGRSERRTDMKPMKEIYLAGGCFWGTEHFLKQIEGVEGTQHRTGIYYTDTADLPVIRETVDRLAANYSRPLVVEIEPLKNFYLAEDYHQDYLDKNPGGYCHINPTLFDLARKAKMKKEGDGEYLNLEK